MYLKPISRSQSWYWKVIQELQNDIINKPGDILGDLRDKMLWRFQVEFGVEDLPGSSRGSRDM